jgi:hypothetical protein
MASRTALVAAGTAAVGLLTRERSATGALRTLALAALAVGVAVAAGRRLATLGDSEPDAVTVELPDDAAPTAED